MATMWYELIIRDTHTYIYIYILTFCDFERWYCVHACMYACVWYEWEGGKCLLQTVSCKFSIQMSLVGMCQCVCAQISCRRCWPTAKSCLVSAAAIAIKTITIVNMFVSTLYYASNVNRANTHTRTSTYIGIHVFCIIYQSSQWGINEWKWSNSLLFSIVF